MKNQLCILLVIAVSLGWGDSSIAADATDTGRVSAVVELTDGELQSLLQTGVFKMAIPKSYKNKVNSLILKRPERFKDEVAVLFNDVDKRANTIAISVDDSTIEQIAYQPVELKIYESGYTNIMVRYRPGNGIQAEEPSKYDSVELKIMLLNGKTLTGRLSDMTQFPLKSSLGKVKVQLNEVSQITVKDDGELKVMMFNGDTLTGETNFSSILVNSRWGQEKIKLKDIASIAAPLSSELSALEAMLPTHRGMDNSIAATNQQSLNQPYVAYPQHQFPMGTGRIDTLPLSPRQMHRRVPQPLPMGSFFDGSLPMPYQSPPPVHSYAPFPSHAPVYSELPAGQPQINEVPVSQYPIDNLSIGQPLPLMTPNQANDFWLFPQN